MGGILEAEQHVFNVTRFIVESTRCLVLCWLTRWRAHWWRWLDHTAWCGKWASSLSPSLHTRNM